ncbi:MAG: aminopeptidase P family protein [Erysipelotrichaceae bacterium]|nr:aminopeptidase P family protein [Erysipelotrichaceae bacterium]
MTTDRLNALRQEMKAAGVQAVIVPTSDFHDTEYTSDYFQARAWLSGFTGSAGTLVVLENGGALWTDGRYFVQAAAELKGSGIELMKMGEKNTPSIVSYLISNLKEGDTAAFDGRTISLKDYDSYKKQLGRHGISLKTDTDFPGLVWKDRPALPATPTFVWEEKYAGKSIADKLADVRREMKKHGARHHVITKIDETAWLLNMRADDIPYFPAFLSYLILSEDGGTLYIDQTRLDAASKEMLAENGIKTADYDQIYEDIEMLEGPVLLQDSFVNSSLGLKVKEPVFGEDPAVLMKAVKNPVEMEGARQAHIKDGAAVVRFWKWLEENVPAGNVTEISASGKLHEFRQEQPKFLEESFATISAYGPNAAMPHYHASKDHPVVIEPKGLYLVDSGGQYLEGTTDITRTFVVGDLTEEEREGFTRVLQGHIALADAKFLHGCRGTNLDILARQPLWEMEMNFNHGTGHGVGALSSVHEAPNGFRWQIVPERNDSAVLEEGMITSDEPGLYIEDKFGIRHENLLLCRKGTENEYGQFMYHEPLTMVPFDVKGLDLSLMTGKEIDWLNGYHKLVAETLKPLLTEEENAWLAEKTAPLQG